MQSSTQSTAQRLYAAESILTLFSQLDTSAFPWEERIAVGSCQAKAASDLIDIYCSERNKRRLNRLRVRPSRPAAMRPQSVMPPLASYLVDRSNPARQ